MIFVNFIDIRWFSLIHWSDRAESLSKEVELLVQDNSSLEEQISALQEERFQVGGLFNSDWWVIDLIILLMIDWLFSLVVCWANKICHWAKISRRFWVFVTRSGVTFLVNLQLNNNFLLTLSLSSVCFRTLIKSTYTWCWIIVTSKQFITI